MKPQIRNILIFLVFLGMISCSPLQKANRKLRRADRLIKEAIELGITPKVDTVFVTQVVKGDTVRVNVPYLQFVNSLRDTVIYQDRVKIHFKTIRDTVKIQVDCPDSVVKVPVTVHKSIECAPVPTFWENLFKLIWWIVAILTLILLIIAAIKWKK